MLPILPAAVVTKQWGMISTVQKLPAGNGLRIWLLPPAQTGRIRLLRKDADSFTGWDDADALLVSDGEAKVIIDITALANDVPVYYRAYYWIGSGWTASQTVSATPSAGFVSINADALSLVRDRLELGLAIFVKRGLLVHERNYIPVLTASPQIEEIPLPLVTVHLESDSSEVRGLGEIIGNDRPISGGWRSVEGWYSRIRLTIVGWSLNADERIALRNALKAVLMANLPVFDDAGLLQIDCSFSDIEDFQSYAAPVYQALCNFSCLAPSAVESTDPAIRDVVTHLIYEATNG